MSQASGPILVTGAGGFIGSHLVEHLLEQGRPVRALLRYTSDSRLGQLDELVAKLREAHAESALPELGPSGMQVGPLQVVWGDVCDGPSMRPLCEGMASICHLSALIGIPYSYVAPTSYVQVNVTGTLHLLEAARQAEVPRFIQTSTSEVYGTPAYTPIDLDHPLQGQSPYSATKIGADKLSESFAHAFGMNVTILRPFNTYGPRQSLRAVIPTIIAQALAGDAIELGNLDAVRDFTYVRDTCRAYTCALAAPLEPGATIHLGTGEGLSIKQVIDQIGQLLGRELRVESSASRMRPPSSEVDILLSDPSVARESIGWRAETSFREGLERTIEWIRHNRPDGEGRYHV